MAQIKVRARRDGSVGYTAVIRLQTEGKIIHQEAKTFSRRAEAEQWARGRELELENPTSLRRAQEGGVTLGGLIRWYIDEFEAVSRWQRSKGQHLRLLEKQPIARADALTLTAQALIDHIRTRRRGGAGPATCANDLVWLGVVLRAAESVKGLPVQPEVVDKARNACRELRLIGKSKRRERRPTPNELQALDTHFASRDARAEIPMRDVMWFAIQSARREAEICRLEWADNDSKARTGVVRDAKHPKQKEGNHRTFKYTPEAWAIVQRQTKKGPYIFPYNPKSVGAAFTRACQFLGIEDLTFHDLRHEATSRLFERGYQIHEVAQFTLHDSWNELKRYANLRPANVREISAPALVADQSAPRGQSRSPAKGSSDLPA